MLRFKYVQRPSIFGPASHTLQYKHEESIPPPIRRAIHRASALLEIVDLEFERVLEQRENYREGVSVDIDNQLNSDLLEKVLDSILPEKNKVLDREDYADLLEDLFYFDIKTQKQLIDLWKKHRSASLKEDSERAKEKLQDNAAGAFAKERAKNGVFFVHVGLIRTALGNEYGKKWSEYMTEKNKRDKS